MAEDGAVPDSILKQIRSIASDVKDLVKTITILNKKLAAKEVRCEQKLNSEMEEKKAKGNNFKNSVSLQPGYWFFPSDKMLINALEAKMLNQQHLIPDKYRNVNFYHYTPQQLSELHESGRESVWYFFVKRDKYIRESQEDGIFREAKDGYWKCVDYVDLPINTNDGINGFKKFFVYLDGGDTVEWGVLTDWVMQEYRIDDDPQLDGWTLCKMYKMDEHKRKRELAEDFWCGDEDCDYTYLELEPYHIFGNVQVLDYEEFEDAISSSFWR